MDIFFQFASCLRKKRFMIKVLVSEGISSSESEPVLAGCVKQNNYVLSKNRQMSSRGRRTVWEIGVEGHKYGIIVSVHVKQNKIIYIYFL